MSGPFRFRLDAALQQRLRQEQEVQVALARTVQARGQVVESLERLERQLTEDRRQASGAPKLLDMEARMRLLFYFDRSEGQMQEQRASLGKWDQEVARVQVLLTRAAARRRALERLRERRMQEFHLEAQRKMDREIDERASLRGGKQASSEGAHNAYSAG